MSYSSCGIITFTQVPLLLRTEALGSSNNVGAEVYGVRRFNIRHEDAALLLPRSNPHTFRTFDLNFVLDESIEPQCTSNISGTRELCLILRWRNPGGLIEHARAEDTARARPKSRLDCELSRNILDRPVCIYRQRFARRSIGDCRDLQ